jgi:DNA invertase Pin-like site-specific DNA recombinase
MREYEKITTDHLVRKAYLYIRQSSLRQVFENTESTERQYGLQRKAMDLGWPKEQIVVIDNDLGISAASGSEREGFRRLVAEVGMGHAGIVIGLEVSRLARNCSEWHKLLEICGLTRTLIMDEDGLYDPTHFNDRLLLGLKGTMSEAELHIIRARLLGGMLNKARRGELPLRLPVGFILNGTGKTVFDPDIQVQKVLRLFFEKFKEQGSSQKVVRFFRLQGIHFPKRLHTGPDKGKLIWVPLTTSRAIGIVHNPCYAGAYAYGRRQSRRDGDGHLSIKGFPQQKWHTLIMDAHEGYITWKEFEENQRQLTSNLIYSQEATPPREGPGLLQGIVVCGVCGGRMAVRYHKNYNRLYHHYCCKGMGNTQAFPYCQVVSGTHIDKAVGELLLEVITPTAIEVALAVQEEVQKRIDDVERLYRQQIERASYEADLARRRYMEVDPSHRLVACTLESEWNESLLVLKQAQEDYERHMKNDRLRLSDEARSHIFALVSDFPRLWRNPKVPIRERKRMMRLMIEDVTLIKASDITVKVRFKGGATRILNVPSPQGSWEIWKTSDPIVREIDRLLDDHTYGEIASMFNNRGLVTGMGKVYTHRRIRLIQRYYGLKSRADRLRDEGLLTIDEITQRLGITKRMVRHLRSTGRLPVGYKKLSDAGDCMYEPPPSEREGEIDKFDAKDTGGAL